LVMTDGEDVEQALRGMGVTAVAGVDDVHVRRDVTRDQMGGARLRVTYHEHVGVHGGEIVDRVEYGLALGLRRGSDEGGEHVGRQALGGGVERCWRGRR